MTDQTRRQAITLAGLLVVLVAVLWYRSVAEAPAVAPPRPSNPAARNAAPAGQDVPVSGVKLELLKTATAPLADAVRNPFRFGAQAGSEPGAVASGGPRREAQAAPEYVPPQAPPGPPPPAPIPLRFIGLIDEQAGAPRVAVLSDGRGTVLYGKEGDIIDGRYRVLRISADSADLSYTDGRGRQTFRLSGQ
jgi:hypothetical protein